MAAAIPIISLAVTVASTAFAAVSQIQQGRAQSRAAEQQAMLNAQMAQREAAINAEMATREAELNAGFAERNAANARRAAEIEASNFSEKQKRLRGEMIARRGASGVSMEGSPLLVLQDFERQTAIDISRIKERGEMSAEGYEMSAKAAREMAALRSKSLFEMAGEQSRAYGIMGGLQGSAYEQAGMYGAGKTLLTGFGESANALYKTGNELSWW